MIKKAKGIGFQTAEGIFAKNIEMKFKTFCCNVLFLIFGHCLNNSSGIASSEK